MGKENEIEVIELSPSSSEKDGTPLRPIPCLKSSVNMRKYEEMEDCFILDFDPFDTVDVSRLSVSKREIDDDGDLSVLAEKGQVACRDYPHSREFCVKFPFESTPHESYCELCYCYVCDSAAPCKYWVHVQSAHCHATEQIKEWKMKRALAKTAPGVCK